MSQKSVSGRTVYGFFAVILVFLLVSGSCSAAETAPESSGTDTWSALQEAVRQAEDGDVLILSCDLTALPSDSMLVIEKGRRITLDLNGHTLDRNLKERGKENGCVLYIREGAILTLRDSGEAAGAITGGYHDDGGGIQNHGTLIMEGGCVTGNTALHSGGGVANTGTMVFTGGSVTGNTALLDGSDIYNEAKGHLTVGGSADFGRGEAKDGSIYNEGTLTVLDARSGEVHIEDMPVLRHFMGQQSILPTAALLLVLLLTVRLDAYLSRERMRVMIMIVLLVFSLMLQNYWDYRLSLENTYNRLRIPLSVLGYALRPVILVMFLYIVKPDGRYPVAWALVGVNTTVYMTAFFSDIAFHFSPHGHFMAGPLHHTCTLVSAVLYAWLFFLTMRQFRPLKRKESWIPILVTVLIGGAVTMDFTAAYSEQPVSFLTMGIAISCVFYYIWLHLQFVREHEAGLRAEKRIQMMKTQIQPHFLFNTLNTIRAVYTVNPPLADLTLEKFSKYLRQNLDAMEQPDLIPFSREMEHTRLYADIEKLRFPQIRMEYRIDDEDFVIPALSVQPMVENAIRHGVRSREEGIVSVSSYRDERDHVVEIWDNGVGFDRNAKKQPGETHIGIMNVRERVEQLCGGSLRVESEIGKGTKITLRIPFSASGSGKGLQA